MSESDLLIGIAQIAVGVAGFGGIVAALSTRQGPWQPLDRWRLVVLLRGSFSMVVLALVPLVTHTAGFIGSGLWRLCSGIFLVYYLYAPLWIRKGYRLRAAHRGPTSMTLAIALLSGETATAMLQLVNAIWLQAAWPYLIGLVWGLVVSFVVFVELLLLSLTQSESSPAA